MNNFNPYNIVGVTANYADMNKQPTDISYNIVRMKPISNSHRHKQVQDALHGRKEFNNDMQKAHFEQEVDNKQMSRKLSEQGREDIDFNKDAINFNRPGSKDERFKNNNKRI